MKIAVTGGTGSWDRGVGPVVIAALTAKGYEVTNLDRAVPGGIERSGFIKVDLTDYGQTFAALYGHDAVIQLAANGEPDWDHVSGAAMVITSAPVMGASSARTQASAVSRLST